MQIQTEETSRPRGEPPRTLDELLRLDAETLASLYRGASVPKLEGIAGDLRGRMLAWPAVRGRAAELLSKIAASDHFPWRGKSFNPLGAGAGEGVNRIVSDGVKLFKFTTSVGPSRAGAFDAVQLDYDHASNPFFIRAIKDEIRELRPGLYLGQAYLHLKDRDHLVLFFGLTSH
jgi:hypothetical protein